MYYSKIKPVDIANGTGVRVSLFVSGCRNHCKGCFNPETWSFTYGQIFDKSVEEKIIKMLAPEYISGLTILGGDPMEKENIDRVVSLCKKVKQIYTDKTIWVYTGYKFENIKKTNNSILKYIDILVDGQFKEELKDLMLKFKGSKNQRIIDVQESIRTNTIIEILLT